MNQFIKQLVVVIPIFLAIDLVWLGVVARSFYRNQLGSLLRMKPDGGLDVIWWAAFVVYLVIPLGIVMFALPRAEGGTWMTAAFWGALYGATAYMIYDFTNYSLLKGWPLQMVVVDVLWGAVLSGTVAAISFAVLSRWS